MANSKSVIREIDLKNININLNKNKSIISDFTGFNKNTGVWFNGVLSNLYRNDNKETDADVITVGEDVYKIVGNELYKNDVLVKDYSNTDKVSTEILPNIEENVLAYTPQVYVYYEGANAYVKSGETIISVGTYNTNNIPYIVVDKVDDTWCVLYGKYAVCKGMTRALSASSEPTAALYLDKKWYYVNNVNLSLINVQDKNDTITIDKTANIIDGAVTVTGWTPTKYRVIQIDSGKVFAGIEDLSVSDTPTVTLRTDMKAFQYLKGFWIENNGFEHGFDHSLVYRPHNSDDGTAVDVTVPNGYELHTQAYNAFSKLSSIKTKFLAYNSYLAIPYGTLADATGVPFPRTNSSLDGPWAYLLESCYTKEDYEFMTLTGSVVNGFPKLLGLFNSNYSPEWLSTDISNFKLIYNKDALAGISRDGSLVVPWNDVDENSLTIVGDDIYYYSLNSNAWMHVNVVKENKLKALKVGNNLLLNSTKDNCYNNNKDEVETFSADTSLANFRIYKPRQGLINNYGIQENTFIMTGSTANYQLGNKWLTDMLEDIKKTEPYYISIVGKPIWAATQLQSYNKTINVRKDIWQYTLNPVFDTENINYEYYLKNMYTSGTFDAYVALTGSVLSYYKSWYKGSPRYNNKLADTEKSVTEPTYYNLSPNIDIMTFIDGFNTVALIKVGNNTVQLLVKESELMLVYNILSNVSNISDYFVLQGMQYGIINGYINKVDMVDGQVVSQTPITSVEGLKFLGNTDKQAFFFSQMNKTISYFSADNTLEFLADATELDNNTTTVFAKQTNDIFVLLNDKVVVLTDSGSMYEMLTRAEYITFGNNSWSDGNTTWSYYKVNNEQERVPIQLETLWYGDTTTRRLMKATCLYIELYDDNYAPGKFEISLDSLMNNTVSTNKQVFNVKSSDYDRITKTVYLRFQPSVQNCAAFKLNINSELPIKRLAVGYSSEGVPVIAKNNI